ncbi:MAG: TetR/AcrR family transcriptional regulator [Candidatus Limnocylindria bacterium]
MPTPARTSLAAIVAAGRGILEANGVDGLTMHRVALAVGVRAPSLYKRVRSRAALVQLIVDDVVDELGATLDAAAGSGDPRRDLRALADAFRTFAHEHPEGYRLIFAGPSDAARADPDRLERASAAVLRTAAALSGPYRALEAARTVTAWAHGFISMELAGAFQLGGDVDDAYRFGIERLGDALATN